MSLSVDRWVAPLFKGDAPAPTGSTEHAIRQRNEIVMTGINPTTGLPIDRKLYIDCLQNTAKDNPSLAQNVGRMAAAVIDAVDGELVPAGLVAVEGCTWDWGQKPRRGAEIHHSIFEGVIPEEQRDRVPEFITQPSSGRTLEEVRVIRSLANTREIPHFDLVTHEYHEQRTRAIVHEILSAVESNQRRSVVMTPKAIQASSMERTPIPGASLRFLHDIITLSEPPAELIEAEQKKERILWTLMRTRQMLGGVIDPEAMILWGMKALRMR